MYHNIDDPLGIDDDVNAQNLGVKVLNGAQTVQKAHRLAHLRAVNGTRARERFGLVPLKNAREAAFTRKSNKRKN